jgi:hypothetical protein
LELHLAPVDAHELYEQRINVWTHEISGLDLSSLHSCATNTRYPNRFERSALLSDPAMLARIELRDVETPVLAGEVNVTVRRAGVLHGLCGWFAADLAEGITLHNAPGDTTSGYAQTFFPIEQPTAVKEGDEVTMSIHSYDNLGSKWQVEVNVRSQTVAKFQHSTLLGFPLSEERLRTLLPTHKPLRSRRGDAERFLLELCDGRHPLETLTNLLVERYPDMFRSPDEAVGFVREIISRAT